MFGRTSSNSYAPSYSSNAYTSNNHTSNSYGNTSNTYNSYRQNISQASNPKIGSYRVRDYDSEKFIGVLSKVQQYKQYMPSSISIRQQTLHLSPLQLRAQDYYLIRTKALQDKHRKAIDSMIDKKCFNPSLMSQDSIATIREGISKNQTPLSPQIIQILCNGTLSKSGTSSASPYGNYLNNNNNITPITNNNNSTNNNSSMMNSNMGKTNNNSNNPFVGSSNSSNTQFNNNNMNSSSYNKNNPFNNTTNSWQNTNNNMFNNSNNSSSNNNMFASRNMSSNMTNNVNSGSRNMSNNNNPFNSINNSPNMFRGNNDTNNSNSFMNNNNNTFNNNNNSNNNSNNSNNMGNSSSNMFNTSHRFSNINNARNNSSNMLNNNNQNNNNNNNQNNQNNQNIENMNGFNRNLFSNSSNNSSFNNNNNTGNSMFDSNRGNNFNNNNGSYNNNNQNGYNGYNNNNNSNFSQSTLLQMMQIMKQCVQSVNNHNNHNTNSSNNYLNNSNYNNKLNTAAIGSNNTSAAYTTDPEYFAASQRMQKKYAQWFSDPFTFDQDQAQGYRKRNKKQQNQTIVIVKQGSKSQINHNSFIKNGAGFTNYPYNKLWEHDSKNISNKPKQSVTTNQHQKLFTSKPEQQQSPNDKSPSNIGLSNQSLIKHTSSSYVYNYSIPNSKPNSIAQTPNHHTIKQQDSIPGSNTKSNIIMSNKKNGVKYAYKVCCIWGESLRNNSQHKDQFYIQGQYLFTTNPSLTQLTDTIFKQIINQVKDNPSEQKLIRRDANLTLQIPHQLSRHQYSVKGTLVQNKINVGKGYDYVYDNIQGWNVTNLTITNKIGRVLWPGTINIREVDFQQDLDFVYNQIEMKGPLQENYDKIITMNSLPSLVEDELPDQKKANYQMQRIIKKAKKQTNNQGIFLIQIDFKYKKYTLRINKTEPKRQ